MTSRCSRLGILLFTAALAASCGGGTQSEQSAPPPAESASAAPAVEAPAAAPVTPAVPEETGPPVIVVDTAKGSFEIQTYPEDAPKSVAHIVELVRKRFYNGQRVHRVEPGFVVQFGDPYSRDMSRRERWGTGGSGTSIGVSEAKRTHGVGAVALAHAGDPRGGDSQMYVTLTAVPRLDRDFTVFGQVTSGMDVVRRLEVEDVIKRITLKTAAPAAAR